jgi:hypothetical protein
MGLSANALEHLTALGRAGHIPRSSRYLDFGSQNIYGPLPREAVESFLSVFSHKDRYVPAFAEHGAKAEALMAAANFDYVAFDMYTGGKTQAFDLNYGALPGPLCSTFDVVANFGTSEHVANQYNVFKVAHDALKVGGVMYNTVPFYGGVDHGLVNYQPKFFTTLIANNSYQPLCWDFTDIFTGASDFYQDVSAAGNGALWEGEFAGSALMDVIFRKTRNAPFQPPTDAVLEGDRSVGHPTINATLARSPRHGGRPASPPASRNSDGGLEARRSRLREKADDLGRDAQIERLRREIEAMRSSKSWRVTAPLRSVWAWLRRLSS